MSGTATAYVLMAVILACCMFDAVTASSVLFIPSVAAFLGLVALTPKRRVR